jgi:CheY-like chemotaxis protein
VRQVIARVLVSAGYRVTEAASAAAALEYGEADPAGLDLLLTDIAMPGMSGLELARELAVSRPHLPTLFVSAYPRRAIVELQALSDERGFLQKPFRADVLLRKVREVLDRAGRSPADAAQTG